MNFKVCKGCGEKTSKKYCSKCLKAFPISSQDFSSEEEEKAEDFDSEKEENTDNFEEEK